MACQALMLRMSAAAKRKTAKAVSARSARRRAACSMSQNSIAHAQQGVQPCCVVALGPDCRHVTALRTCGAKSCSKCLECVAWAPWQTPLVQGDGVLGCHGFCGSKYAGVWVHSVARVFVGRPIATGAALESVLSQVGVAVLAQFGHLLRSLWQPVVAHICLPAPQEDRLVCLQVVGRDEPATHGESDQGLAGILHPLSSSCGRDEPVVQHDLQIKGREGVCRQQLMP